jgi:lipopolysaccharide cholinephosphotransferase
MKKVICFFLCFAMQLSLFALTPRLLIILGDNCSFTAEELKKEIHCTILDGTSNQIKEAITLHDQFDCNHIFIIKGKIDRLTSFSEEIGFDVILVNKDLHSAVVRIFDKINQMPHSDADLPRMNPKTVGLFYTLMKTVHTFFGENDVLYWLTAGTLLGSIRHQGMIPWDDDLDIAILQSDLDKLLSLEPKLSDLGLEICYHPSGFYKIYPKNGKTIDDHQGGSYMWKYPFLDIFVYDNYNGKLHYASPRLREIWPNEYFLLDEISFPLKTHVFGPLEVFIPHQTTRILHRFYGLDWDKVTYIRWNHQDEKKIKKIKVPLENFNPPEYEWPESLSFSN